jgi:hypothetical protein
MLPIGSVGIAIGDTVTGRARAVKRHGVERFGRKEKNQA